jgi:PKD repeat protein
MQGNGLTLRVDDYGNSPSTATPLTGGVTSGTVTTYTLAGVISSASDVDVVSFSAGSVGVVTATLVPATRSPNLDAVVALLGSGGGVLATANPATSLGASLTFTLPAPGTYYVSVRGTGYLDPLTTGYSSYGSLGNYQLTLATPAGGGGGGGGGSPPTAVAVATTPTSGTAPLTVGFSGAGSTDSDGTITSYSWTFGNGQTGTGVTTTHVFTTPGTFSVTLRTTDNSALSTTSAPVVVVVSGGTVRLAGLTLTTIVTQASRNRLRAQARAVVTVVDGNGGVVSGAVVSVRWSGLVTGTTSGTTGAAGTVTFLSSTTLNRGTFSLTVTGITKTGFTSAANLVSTTGSVAW